MFGALTPVRWGQGHVHVDPSTRVGFLPQEPQLDETTTVEANLRSAVAEKVALLEEFEEVRAGEEGMEGVGHFGFNAGASFELE